MPWLETNVMEQRIKFVARALVGDVKFGRLCAEFNVSRSTGYRWVRRYRERGGFCDLTELSRRPLHSPRKTPAATEARVIALRKKYGYGAKKLSKMLRRDEGIELPVITTHRIIRRNGLIDPKDSHPPLGDRFEKQRPNEMWQMDFKGEYPIEGGYCFPLSILDDHSRYDVGLHALSSQRGGGVHDRLVKTFEEYGVPDTMLMDHGVPWWSVTNGHGLTWVSVKLIKQGIRLRYSGVRHPQTQGKVERFHRTLKHSVNHKGKPSTLPGWEALLGEFRYEYNHIRPHEALEMDVPANRYEPSRRAYDPDPPEWEYPEGSAVKRLNTQGCLDHRSRRYFVCEALAAERVRVEEIDNRLLVSYRHMYIREINIESGATRALILSSQNP